MMNCEKFQTIVPDVAREKMIEVRDRVAALQHAAVCDRCANALNDERSLTSDLAALRSEARDVCAPSLLEERMVAAFRRQQRTSGTVITITRRNRFRYWATAVAAMVILTLGFFVVRARLTFREPSQQASTPDKQSTLPGISGVIPKRDADVPVTPAVAGVNPQKHRTPKLNFVAVKHAPKLLTPAATNSDQPTQTTAEVATDFFPIGYNSTPNLQEGGQLLRVEMSRSVVARFGLPVNMDRAGERVKADVLVGADGLAQAIRFVQ